LRGSALIYHSNKVSVLVYFERIILWMLSEGDVVTDLDSRYK